MKSSIVLVAVAFLCLVVFPTTIVGKNLRFWRKPIVEGWPKPSEISRNEMLMSTSHKFNYGDSKVWKCTYSNGSAPAISISPSVPTTPSHSHPTPKTSPPPPTPSPPTPKRSSSPPRPTPKKSPSPSQPSNPPTEHHHYQNQWEHIDSCMRNMVPVAMCRAQMDISYNTKMFQVSDYCCNLIVNMRNECDDVIWGFFIDPFFVPLVRYTCHVTY